MTETNLNLLVFFSYSSDDYKSDCKSFIDKVFRIAAEATLLPVMYDQQEKNYSEWKKYAKEAVKSCRCFVFFISENSLNNRTKDKGSDNELGGVFDELHYLIETYKNPKYSPYFLLCFLNNDEKEIFTRSQKNRAGKYNELIRFVEDHAESLYITKNDSDSKIKERFEFLLSEDNADNYNSIPSQECVKWMDKARNIIENKFKKRPEGAPQEKPASPQKTEVNSPKEPESDEVDSSLKIFGCNPADESNAFKGLQAFEVSKCSDARQMNYDYRSILRDKPVPSDAPEWTNGHPLKVIKISDFDGGITGPQYAHDIVEKEIQKNILEEKLLLLDPRSKIFDNMIAMIDDQKLLQKHLDAHRGVAELAQKYKNFQVKYYDHEKLFKLIDISGISLQISPYNPDGKYEYTIEPAIEIKHNPNNPIDNTTLYQVIEDVFDQEWKESIPLEDVFDYIMKNGPDSLSEKIHARMDKLIKLN